jgi:low temperature requirement protein LtrA
VSEGSKPDRPGPHLVAVLRGDVERVIPLELFFDLVFVLAITQCTALMAANPTWSGLGQGALVLGVLWWAWVGYAWLTSVVDPEEGAVRIVMFAAMAALLVVALCVPEAFGRYGLLFAGAYASVRIAHIALFLLCSRNDPALRSSVVGLAVSTGVGTGLLLAASFADGVLQAALWVLALGLDMGGPYFFGIDGWRLVPGHFAERHGLIVLIALGESIVAIGVGATSAIDAGVVAAAVIGTAVASALWWLYFDVVALVAARRLAQTQAGRERNAIARDSFSYLHFPMVLGIVLVALGMKKTLGDVGAHLYLVPAAALLGGTALYLLAHVAFRWRNVHRFSWQRLVGAVACVALIPVAVVVPSLVTLGVLAMVLIRSSAMSGSASPTCGKACGTRSRNTDPARRIGKCRSGLVGRSVQVFVGEGCDGRDAGNDQGFDHR